ncbi:hypothetical protein D2962_03085 [Biomaibacter acetigenes]|uniref:Uncharacterized protein n=1 Tax=Biomaibacter acetigenes TaxID=2316383 RepID=A0A3G2R2K3_9FIRM|nr:hypothetical protein [Biomaibacter acetigenes]AYO29726.1 hypothetical protein D2962_03085 [Biomaibacter acetigenes]
MPEETILYSGLYIAFEGFEVETKIYLERDSGEARTGTGFATGAGYLAFALYKVFIEGENK